MGAKQDCILKNFRNEILSELHSTEAKDSILIGKCHVLVIYDKSFFKLIRLETLINLHY